MYILFGILVEPLFDYLIPLVEEIIILRGKSGEHAEQF
jgi:hypothetical protein